MTYTLDVETFISEVKKYPEIWDLKSEDNRHKSKKQAAWAEIARVFIADFDDMTELEKVDVYRKLHGKWRNIRDSYVRNQKRKDGKKGYLYAKHLAFLSHIYKLQTDCDGDHNHWSDEDSRLRKFGFGTKQILTDSWQSDEDSTLDNSKRKRVKKEDIIEYVDTQLPDPTCSYSVEDEDRSFFDSLLPAVRDFNIDQKLEFRSEVICLIKNIRSNGQKKVKLNPETGDFDL